MEDQIPEFFQCPRCGDQCFEYLETHAHCVACFYSPSNEVEYEQIPDEALRALSEGRANDNPEERLIEAESAIQGVA